MGKIARKLYARLYARCPEHYRDMFAEWLALKGLVKGGLLALFALNLYVWFTAYIWFKGWLFS